jgi:3-oxoacyl-[acyl-carrier protein] reductase
MSPGQLFATQAAAAAMTDAGGSCSPPQSAPASASISTPSMRPAKAAVSAMALKPAPELAERRIAINAIAPGGTATDMAAAVVARYTPPAGATSPPTRSSNR